MELLWTSDFEFCALAPITGASLAQASPQKERKQGLVREWEALQGWNSVPRVRSWGQEGTVPEESLGTMVTRCPLAWQGMARWPPSWWAQICPHITMYSPWSWEPACSRAFPDVGTLVRAETQASEESLDSDWAWSHNSPCDLDPSFNFLSCSLEMKLVTSTCLFCSRSLWNCLFSFLFLSSYLFIYLLSKRATYYYGST